ncbi:MAG: hypothetical protein ACO3JL_11190 [Myxococcota bacterium]
MNSHNHRMFGLLLAVSLLSASGPTMARSGTATLASDTDAATPVQAEDDMPMGDGDMPEGDYDLADDDVPAPAAEDDTSDDDDDDDGAEDDADDSGDDVSDAETEAPTDEGPLDESEPFPEGEASATPPPAPRRFVTTESTAAVAEPEDEGEDSSTWWIAGAGATLGVAVLTGLAAATYFLLDEFGLGSGSVTVTPR